MNLYVKDTLYNLKLFKKFKRWVYDFSDRTTIFVCDEVSGLKCQNCLICRTEKITKREDLSTITLYSSLLCHSDTDGGYITPQFKPDFLTDNNLLLWGNLNRLKLEVKYLHKHLNKMPKDIQEIFRQFYYDVLTSIDILEFKLTDSNA